LLINIASSPVEFKAQEPEEQQAKIFRATQKGHESAMQL
jgi:hypothetical protein